MDKEQVLEKVRNIIPVIQRHITLDFLVLFGSYVKGNLHEHSDIDIAVVSRDVPKEILNDNVINALIDIRDIDLKFEPHFYRLDKWQSATDDSFIGSIKKTGEVIYSNGSK